MDVNFILVVLKMEDGLVAMLMEKREMVVKKVNILLLDGQMRRLNYTSTLKLLIIQD
jgi:hypothetical protein